MVVQLLTGKAAQPASGEVEETRKYCILRDQPTILCNNPLHGGLISSFPAEITKAAASLPQILATLN